MCLCMRMFEHPYSMARVVPAAGSVFGGGLMARLSADPRRHYFSSGHPLPSPRVPRWTDGPVNPPVIHPSRVALRASIASSLPPRLSNEAESAYAVSTQPRSCTVRRCSSAGWSRRKFGGAVAR